MSYDAEHEPRVTIAGSDPDNGTMPSAGALRVGREPAPRVNRPAGLAAFDETHQSSVRGEHRYPDAHQTAAEQRARRERDALKRRLWTAR
jgi:hypothetical protein